MFKLLIVYTGYAEGLGRSPSTVATHEINASSAEQAEDIKTQLLTEAPSGLYTSVTIIDMFRNARRKSKDTHARLPGDPA